MPTALLLRVRSWLREPHRAVTLWLGRHCVWVAWAGLLLAVVSPPHGSGISVCWLQNTIGLPCPGCGVTRSLSCGIRGLFQESWNYHPMGLFILALFALTALQSLFSRPYRERLSRFLQNHSVTFSALYLVFVVAFISFGTVRALLELKAGHYVSLVSRTPPLARDH